MKPETLGKIEARLKYYRDIGISDFYRGRAGACEGRLAGPALSAAATTARTDAGLKAGATFVPSVVAQVRPGVPPKAAGLFDAVDRIEGDTLERIQQDIGPDCTRCKLHRKRSRIVFGVGNPRAELVFVGEGPGAEEDAQGIPFVGRAGQLLTQMIEAMGLKRDDVYICNVVKCRPPENRTPEPDEIATCSPYLMRQLDVIRPKVIVCLGSVAAKMLLNTNQSMGRLRGQWFEHKSSKLLVTYHPAYCLRNPPSKADVWKDLQLAMVELGLPLPPKKK
ncbi:MAG: uracil-DNA glycosylase [Candidatus Acidiferrales bacterium]